MVALHKCLVVAKTPHAKTALQQQAEVTDRQIDRPAYTLYGLTSSVRVVEEATAG